MPRFILDSCIDSQPGQKRYFASFFRDVNTLNDWKVVYGGSKMLKELAAKESMRRVIDNLKRADRAIVLDKLRVDELARQLEESVRKRLGHIPQPCDDFHILAISRLSGCENVITMEQRMGDCIDMLRGRIGQNLLPNPRLIRTEQTYQDLKRRNLL